MMGSEASSDLAALRLALGRARRENEELARKLREEKSAFAAYRKHSARANAVVAAAVLWRNVVAGDFSERVYERRKRAFFAATDLFMGRVTSGYLKAIGVTGDENGKGGIGFGVADGKVKNQPPDLTAGEFNRREC